MAQGRHLCVVHWPPSHSCEKHLWERRTFRVAHPYFLFSLSPLPCHLPTTIVFPCRSYEAWKSLIKSFGGFGAAPWLTSIAAGVLSGWTTQFVIFPIDAAKSRIQAGTGRASSSGLLEALLVLWHEGAMYRGISSMLIRAIPVNTLFCRIPKIPLLLDLL